MTAANNRREAVPTDAELEALTAQINDAHEAVRCAGDAALGHARRAGERLIQAKRQIGHGEWSPWLAKNCPEVSLRTAQMYMQVARKWPELEKRDGVAHLSLRRALAILSARPDDEPSDDSAESDEDTDGGAEGDGSDDADSDTGDGVEDHDTEQDDNEEDTDGDGGGDRDSSRHTRVLLLHFDVMTHGEMKQMIEDCQRALQTQNQSETVAAAIRQAWTIQVR